MKINNPSFLSTAIVLESVAFGITQHNQKDQTPTPFFGTATEETMGGDLSV